MNEVGDSCPSDLTPTGVVVGARSAGAMMRSAREAAGLHIAALAVSLKIPVKKLEALEGDRFDLLPDAVFVRALASSVCRTLKIDPQPVLLQLPQTAVPMLRPDGTGINVPFHQPDGAGRWQFWRQQPKSFALTLSALILGIAALGVFPFEERNVAPTEVAADAGFPKFAGASEAGPKVSETIATAESIQKSSQPMATSTLRTSETINPAAESSATASIPVTSSPSAQSSSRDPSADTLVFKASGVSWVEVVDVSGVVQLRRLLSEGEVVGASGAVPLSVVVGRSNTTKVQVRGMPFDLAPVTRDNVARFEVK